MSLLARRKRSPARRGMSLVEVMVLMTAVATMLGICVMVLGLTMRLEADGRASIERAETISRLASRFRSDVHEARTIAMDGRVLRLGPSGGKVVEYRPDDARVTRVLVRAGKEDARETYRIPQAAGGRFEVREAEGRSFAALVIDVQPRRDRIDPVRTIEVEALAGKTAPPAQTAGGGGRETR